MRATLTIGPDPYYPGTSWGFVFDTGRGPDQGATGGAGGKPRDSLTVDGWLRWARGQRDLREALRRADLGLDWGDVRPFGWSEGAGHAPGGITLTWEV